MTPQKTLLATTTALALLATPAIASASEGTWVERMLLWASSSSADAYERSYSEIYERLDDWRSAGYDDRDDDDDEDDYDDRDDYDDHDDRDDYDDHDDDHHDDDDGPGYDDD